MLSIQKAKQDLPVTGGIALPMEDTPPTDSERQLNTLNFTNVPISGLVNQGKGVLGSFDLFQLRE